MDESVNITFIKHRGTPNEATLVDGTAVARQDKIWVATQKRFVATAPYDNHFIYLLPQRIPGWSLMCTCGMGAVIAGFRAYAKDGSPSTMQDGSTVPGELLVCLAHATTGKHADGSS